MAGKRKNWTTKKPAAVSSGLGESLGVQPTIMPNAQPLGKVECHQLCETVAKKDITWGRFAGAKERSFLGKANL
jgi:hypothetical protein